MSKRNAGHGRRRSDPDLLWMEMSWIYNKVFCSDRNLYKVDVYSLFLLKEIDVSRFSILFYYKMNVYGATFHLARKIYVRKVRMFCKELKL